MMIDTKEWLLQKMEHSNEEELKNIIHRLLKLIPHREGNWHRSKSDAPIHYEFVADKIAELDQTIITQEEILSYQTVLDDYNTRHFEGHKIAKIEIVENKEKKLKQYRLGAFEVVKEYESLIRLRHIMGYFGWSFDLYFEDDILKYAHYCEWDSEGYPTNVVLSPSQFKPQFEHVIQTKQ